MKTKIPTLLHPRLRLALASAVCGSTLVVSAFAQTPREPAPPSQHPRENTVPGSTPMPGHTMTNPTGSTATAVAAGDTGMLARADKRFVMKAAEQGMLEVAVAQLAAQRATNPELRSYAQMLVSEHEQANSELMTLASKKGVMVPTDTEALTSKTRKFSNKTGAEFDRQFAEFAVDSHEDTIELFERATKNSKDTEISAWAAKMLPSLQAHLRQAETLHKTVGM